MFCRLAITPAVFGCPKQNKRKLYSMRITILPFCLLAFLFAFPAQTFAATFVVTTFTDPDNTQGACAAGGGCTLRQAINTANAVAGDDTINFAAVLSGQTILLTPALGQLVISTNMTIDALTVTNVSGQRRRSDSRL
jgi:CSLREA domain-containing protein